MAFNGATFTEITSAKNMFESMSKLNLMWDNFYLFSEIISLYLNSVLFVDVYLTIRNPFYPRENRVKVYWAGAVFITVAMTALFLKFTNISQFSFNPTILSIMFYTTPAFSGITVLSGILVIVRLCYKGTSKELKKLVI